MKDGLPSLGIFISTPGRKSLMRTLWSIAYQQEGVVDILVVGDGWHQATADLCKELVATGVLPQLRYVATKRTRDWGHSQQNYALKHVRGDYILYQDDDDIFLPRSLAMVRKAAASRPGRPIIARVKTPVFGILWQVPDPTTVLDGHCMILPNDKTKLGYFTPDYDGDQCFIHTSLKPYQDEWVWLDTVLTLTRPEWKLWPSWASQGEFTWCCDLLRDDDGAPGTCFANVFLEEDGEHLIAQCTGEFTSEEALEVVEFATWAGQGKDVWINTPFNNKDLVIAAKARGYELHYETEQQTELTSTWPPSWWPLVPRFSHMTTPEGEPLRDWRDEWGA